MGKIVATYLVKVTLREPDAPPAEGAEPTPAPPTIPLLEEAIAAVLATTGLVARATAERTDR